MDDKLEVILKGLREKGWVEVPHFFSPDIVTALLQEQKELFQQGGFRSAGVGRSGDRKVVSEVRGDQILWLDESSPSPFQKRFFDAMAQLQQTLNRNFYLGLNDAEFHFAIYPAGSFYKKHFDRFKDKGNRMVTCILYLNTEWKPEYGGQLRIYPDVDNEEDFLDVQPEGGKFICFMSEEILHEVLLTTRERYSITGWLKN